MSFSEFLFCNFWICLPSQFWDARHVWVTLSLIWPLDNSTYTSGNKEVLHSISLSLPPSSMLRMNALYTTGLKAESPAPSVWFDLNYDPRHSLIVSSSSVVLSAKPSHTALQYVIPLFSKYYNNYIIFSDNSIFFYSLCLIHSFSLSLSLSFFLSLSLSLSHSLCSTIDHDDWKLWTEFKLFSFKMCALAFRCLHGSAPPYLEKCCTRVIPRRLDLRSATAVSGRLVVPKTNTKMISGRAFAISCLLTWNSLPDELHDDSLSFVDFRRKLKIFLF